MQAEEFVLRVRDQEQETPLNIQMIGELRKKVQKLEISLAKARKEGGLLDRLHEVSEENVAATTLMQLLHFIFQRESQIDNHQFDYLKEIFENGQYKLIEAYETHIGTLNKMNSALIT